MQATLTQPAIFTQPALTQPARPAKPFMIKSSLKETSLRLPEPFVVIAAPKRSLPTEPLVEKPRAGKPDRFKALPHCPTPIQNRAPIQNRIGILLVHIPIFSIRGQARLAEEVGVSRSTISRLANGKINPSYRLARAVTDVLERKMGRPLDIREVFSADGAYPTPSGCSLCRCHGCLPTDAWGPDSVLKPEWRDARPGDWSISRPSGSHTGFHRGAGEENR